MSHEYEYVTLQEAVEGGRVVTWTTLRTAMIALALTWGYGRRLKDRLEDAIQAALLDAVALVGRRRCPKACPVQDPTTCLVEELTKLLRRSLNGEARPKRYVVVPEGILEGLAAANGPDADESTWAVSIEDFVRAEAVLDYLRGYVPRKNFETFYNVEVLGLSPTDEAVKGRIEVTSVYGRIHKVRRLIRGQFPRLWRQLQRSRRPASGRRRPRGE